MGAGMAESPPGPGPIRITPAREQAGQRIDRLLAEAIGTISRSRIKALIDEGALSRIDEGALSRIDKDPRPPAEDGEQPRTDDVSRSRTRPATLSGADPRAPSRTDPRAPSRADPHAPSRADPHAPSRADPHAPSPDGVLVTEPAEPARAGFTYTLVLPEPLPAAPRPQAIPFPILYEDRDLIVLDKPAGLVVHPAPGNYDGTLVNALLAHCGPGFTGIGAEKRPGIVHRLDKDTSGVMVVAKTQLANDVLTAAFAARDLDRTYVALCWGLPGPLSGEIEGAIGRDKRERKRMAVVSHGGKAALTRYRVIRAYGTSAALVECRLATGRTHQIRVHMSARGHPIVGDPLYLRRIPATAKALPDALRRALLDFPRQALHAASLGFSHPRTGVAMRFETPPPGDMAALLGLLDGS
jgi:23S rRNA pseudouridine1911/1915/1917 synthase